MSTHVVVDLIYDFIDGSLACKNAIEAIEEAIKDINNTPSQKVLYICDNHPTNHCSFVENGGIWPAHCVQETRGALIHEDFYKKVEKIENRPNTQNTFYKGRDASLEEYSGFNAVSTEGVKLKDACSNNVVVSGVATEYCVKETVLALNNSGFNVTLLKDALSYVDYNGHVETLEQLSKIVTVK